MKIFNLEYIDDLPEKNDVQGGALIPDALSSNFLDLVFADLSNKLSDFRSSDSGKANTGGGTSFESLFDKLAVRTGSGGSFSSVANINLTPPPQGIIIEREAPIQP